MCPLPAWKSLLFHFYLAFLWHLKNTRMHGHTHKKNHRHVQVDRSPMCCKSLRHHKMAALASCCISPVDGGCWGAEFVLSTGAPSDWFPVAALLPSNWCSSCLGHSRASHMVECSATAAFITTQRFFCKGSASRFLWATEWLGHDTTLIMMFFPLI